MTAFSIFTLNIYIFILRTTQKSSPSMACSVTSRSCVLQATCWTTKAAFRALLSFQTLAQNSAGGKEKHALSSEKPLGKSILGIFKRHSDITRNSTHSTTTKTRADAGAQETGLPLSTSASPSQHCTQQRNAVMAREDKCSDKAGLCPSERLEVRTLPVEGRIPGEKKRPPFSMTRDQSLPSRDGCPHHLLAVHHTDILGHGAVWVLSA